MELFVLARVLHVLSIVFWIGGVAMVTTVLLPTVKKMKSPEERVSFFEKIESSFAFQSRISTLIAGITGFYMLYVLNAWNRLLSIHYWWLHSMILVWFIFTFMLFILEPLVLHKLFEKKAKENPEKTFKIIQNLHYILLFISLITILGAVAGSHGWIFI